MKLNETLKTMFTQAGVNVSDATITKILDNPSLASMDVDDAVSKQLTADRFTIDAAKNNPDLLKHFKATVLNGVDAEVYRQADEFGLEETDKTELKSAENSYKRISALVAKINKKANPSQKDKDALTKEVEKLNADIKAIKDTTAQTIAQKDIAFEGERLGWKLDSVYNGFVPKMDEKNDPKVNLIIAKTIVADEIAKRGLKVIQKDGNLSLATSTDTDYFENNVKVGFEDFVSKTLANGRLLNASPKTPARSPERQERHSPENGNGGLKSDKAVAELDAMLTE